MDTKLQVFISSTYKDLIEERQAAVESILKSGHIPAGMELFTSGDKSQWEVIQRWITESDIYMLILGGRYGTTEPDSGISYTELEYDFAVSLNKPFFAVVISEEGLEKKQINDGSEVVEKDNPKKLEMFREKVLSKISSFFTDYKDVKLAVLETLPQLISDYDIKGWIRNDDVLDTKALADEITRLHSANEILRNKIETQSKKIEKGKNSTAQDKEFEELSEVLSKIIIDISNIKHKFSNGAKLGNDLSLLKLSISIKDRLMTGIYNSYGMDDLDSFVFFTICPKLQTYDLVLNEKVASVTYRRYAITKKGAQFFAYMEKKYLRIKNKNAG